MTQFTNILVIWTGAGFITFCLLYGFFAPWWKSEMGRNIMALMGTCGLFLVLAVIKMAIPNAFDHMPWIRPIVWSTIGCIVWWRVVLLLKTQVLKRASKRRGGPDHDL